MTLAPTMLLPHVDTTEPGRTRITMRMDDYQLLIGALTVDAVAPAGACDAERLIALATALVPALPADGQAAVRARCRAVRAARQPKSGPSER